MLHSPPQEKRHRAKQTKADATGVDAKSNNCCLKRSERKTEKTRRQKRNLRPPEKQQGRYETKFRCPLITISGLRQLLDRLDQVDQLDQISVNLIPLDRT